MEASSYLCWSWRTYYTSSGLLADFNDEESMEKAISIFFNQYLDQSIFSFQNKNIDKYSRLGLTQKIASLLDEMI